MRKVFTKLQICYNRGVKLFSVAGQICCSKSFAGQNLVLVNLLSNVKFSDAFRGVLQKKKKKEGLHSALISFFCQKVGDDQKKKVIPIDFVVIS